MGALSILPGPSFDKFVIITAYYYTSTYYSFIIKNPENLPIYYHEEPVRAFNDFCFVFRMIDILRDLNQEYYGRDKLQVFAKSSILTFNNFPVYNIFLTLSQL